VNGTKALQSRPVELALPRWTARRPLSLKEPLMAMGMKQAFEGGLADFSGIDGTRDLVVSAVVHEGFVDVTEEGTEAAAATGVAIGVRTAARGAGRPAVCVGDHRAGDWHDPVCRHRPRSPRLMLRQAEACPTQSTSDSRC
jgi:serine protease inhibitor